MFLFISDMASARCRVAVEVVLNGLQIPYLKVEAGRVQLPQALTPVQYRALQAALELQGFGIIDNKKLMLVDQIRLRIREIVYDSTDAPLLKFTVELSTRLHYDYTYLSNVFSKTTGSTIERLYITLRIGRVKELMLLENRNVTEIARLLHFSSAAHLCLQFKKITGYRPSEFRKLHLAIDRPVEWE